MTPSTPTISDPVDRGLSHQTEKRPDAPTLRESAKHLIVPDGVERTVWPKIKYRLETMGVKLDRWQEGFCRAALGLDASGSYAATIGGVGASIPRQVGKTFLISHLMIAMCVEFPGLRCIWTSHHGRTTTNTFRAVQGAVRKPLVMIHLKKNNRNHGIRTGAGEQEIEFDNGSIMMFGAREQGFGRGMDAVDMLVFDEAQILGQKALEDMVPATNAARHRYGSLLFFIGTPPRPQDEGDAFTIKRAQALSGESRDAMWVEIAGDEELGLHSERQYRMANPSYPLRVPKSAMQRMAKNLTDEHSWRREALGIWDRPDEVEQMLPEWPNLVGVGPEPGAAPDVYAIDRSATGGVTIVAGWSLPDSRVHVEEVFASWDLESAADWLTEASKPRDQILVDAMSSGTALIPLLRARRRRPVKTTTADMIAACALLEEAVKAGTLSHDGGESMMVAVAGAKKRDVRSQTGGGWAWDRRDKETPIHALVAASLAVFGVSRKPERSSGRVVTVS